jgi:muconolactone D-isomerase
MRVVKLSYLTGKTKQKGGEKMLFLKTHQLNEVFYALPAEKRAELTAAAMAFAEKYIKAGKMKEYYYKGDSKGGFAIWDVESNEELIGLAVEYPLTPYTDFETYPVIDYKAMEKMWKERVATQKAGK